MQFKVMFLAVLSCLLWGVSFPILKVGYIVSEIVSASPYVYLSYAGLRFFVAGILLWLLFFKRMGWPKISEYKFIVTIALFQTILQYAFFYIGLSNTTGTKASIIAGANVFITLLVSSLIFKSESLTTKKILGCILGFLGIFIVNYKGGQLVSFQWLGEGFILLANVAYAFSTNFMKKFGQTVMPLKLATYQFIFGGMIMFLIGSAMGGDFVLQNVESLSIVGFLGMASAAAYAIWSHLLKSQPVSRVAVFGFTTPIFGVVFSNILLGELENLPMSKVLLALFCICVGIILVNLSPKRKFDV